MKHINRRTRVLMEDAAGYAFISPWLIGFVAFSIIPILFSLYYSFTDYDILGDPVFNGLNNFRRMAGDQLFWQ
ncbi:MAG: sugar ABC transporter permease, partial [Spirochaetia bacterium]|nr:sugar ABC transporter permease [Spirochaetia bacterium]